MRRLLPLLLIASVALFAAGCGSSDDSSSDATPTEEWADSLCSAVATWTTAISGVGDSLGESGLSEDAIRSAADEAKSATETLIDDLGDLGRPDTEAGQEAKDSVDQLTEQLEQEVDKIESAADDVLGVSGVLTAISTVTATLASMGSQLSSTFSELEQLDAVGELEDAFRESDSCQGITDDQP